MRTVHHLAALWRKILHGFHLHVVSILSAEYHIFRDLAVVDKSISPVSWQLYKKTKWPDIDHPRMMYTPKSRYVICDAGPASCMAGPFFSPAPITMGHEVDDACPRKQHFAVSPA